MERSDALSLAGCGEHENYLIDKRAVVGKPTAVTGSDHRATGIAVTESLEFCRLL